MNTSNDTARWDVFLSYAGPDQALADRLRRELTEEGISVWWDIRELSTEESTARVVERLAHGVAGSRLFVALVTPNYSWRRYCQLELSSALLALGGAVHDRIIAVSKRQHRDWIQPTRLRRESVELPEPGPAPELVRALRSRLDRLHTPIGRIAPITPDRWYGRHEPLRMGFVGHQVAFWRMDDLINEHGDQSHARHGAQVSARRRIHVSSRSAESATRFVEEYALRFGARFPGGVFWADIAGSDDQQATLRFWQHLALRLSAGPPHAWWRRSADELRSDVVDWLRGNLALPALWVAVAEGSASPSEIDRWTTGLSQFTEVLVTPEDARSDCFASIRIDSVESERGVDLLAAQLGRDRHRLSSEETSLALRCTGNPVALGMVAAILKRSASKGGLQPPGTDTAITVAGLLDSVLGESVQPEGRLSVRWKMLALMAVPRSSLRLPREVLEVAWLAVIQSGDANARIDPAASGAVVRELTDLGLVRESEDGSDVALEPEVHAALRDLLSRRADFYELERYLVDATLVALDGAIGQTPSRIDFRCIALARALSCPAIDASSADLADVAGKRFHDQGLYAYAEECSVSAVGYYRLAYREHSSPGTEAAKDWTRETETCPLANYRRLLENRTQLLDRMSRSSESLELWNQIYQLPKECPRCR